MDMMALGALGVAAALCAVVVRQKAPELAVVLVMAGCVLLLWETLPVLETIRDVLEELADLAALSPQVLILDNPSAELDPAATENLYSALAALNARGMTVVAAEQKVGLLCRFSTQMIVMAEGGAALCGTTRQVMNETETLASAGVMFPRRIELGAWLRAEGLYDGDMPLDIPRAAAMVRGISQ